MQTIYIPENMSEDTKPGIIMELQEKIEALTQELLHIYARRKPPENTLFQAVIKSANQTLLHEDEELRPYDVAGKPGGLILLDASLPTIIIPDIHARMDFLLSIFFHKDSSGKTVLEKLSLNLLQLVCVGDGMHAEGRAVSRWREAFDEYLLGYETHTAMDQEMAESFGVMEMVMHMKTHFPKNFHFLKGNHENILNERGEGNYPFIKYSNEGPMVTSYVLQFYGKELVNQYYLFEKNLPVLAVGKNFIISHAEPSRFFDRDEVIAYRYRPEVIEGLTWTDNNAAETGSVFEMIKHYIENEHIHASYYFGGHRPVSGNYNLRANSRYVQIHNPGKFLIVCIDPAKEIEIERDIFEIENIADTFEKHNE